MTDVGLDAWEGVPADELARRWRLPAVHLYASVGSTNDLARRLAADGAASGTVVLAERQVAGRGRAGRAWDSPGGLGLWLSMVLRAPQLASPGTVPLRVGLAVAEALDAFAAPRRVEVKWPNDLLVEGRKLGGILCEAAWERSAPVYLVAGIGLNVLHGAEDFPPELRRAATSLHLASQRLPSRLALADAVLGSLVAALEAGMALGPPELGALESRDALRGRAVTVREPTTGEPLAEGTVMGISPEGALLLRTASGALRSIRSGTVRPAE